MKLFMLFLCLAAAEKLDRTYLPPPGSKFSGGIDGDIQAPFEIPKETYSTTFRPDIYKNGALSPDNTKIEIGINRVPPTHGSPGNIITSGGHRPSDYYQNTYKVPTTTTSYAFTTTTTHPPNEAYETTAGHINPITGLPTTAFDFPTTAPSFINPEGNFQGNQQVPFQQTRQPGRRPVNGPSQYPATSTLAPTSQFVEQSRPNFVQGQGQVQSQRPGIAPGLVQRPDTSSSQDLSQPNLPQENNFNQDENQRPGFQPGPTQRPGFSQTEDLFKYQGSRHPANVPGIGQQNFLVPSTSPPGTTPSAVQYGGDLDQGILYNQNNVHSKPINNIPVPNYPGQNQFENNIAPGQQLQQVLQQGPYRQPGQAQYGQSQGISAPSQYPVSQTDELGRPINQSNNIYKPISTVSSNSQIPDSNQYFGTTPGSQPSTTVYPTGSYPITPISPNTGNQVNPSGFGPRPERPQAESDKNAIILNYENVITPEGFAYTFDTSNGIHADESGTAVDGVKAKGSYSYVGDDGKLYSIVYTADENGFVPHGDHLPTSPPIPEAIKKVIEQAKKDQEDGISDDGTYNEDKYGHMKYQGKKLQRPNRINIDGEVPEKYNNQYTQNNRQKQRPQNGHKVPVFSNKNDYNEDFEEEQRQDGESPINNDNRLKFTSDKPLLKRPVEVPAGNNGEYDTHFNDETGVKIGSNHPIHRPSDDRRQFGSKFSVQRPDQYFENDKNNLKPGQGNTSIENYPVFIKSKEKYYVDANRNKPIDNQSIKRVGGKLDNSQDYKDLGDYDNSNPTDIPSDFGNNEQREYNNKVYNSEEPTQKPGQSSSTSGSFQDRYGNRISPKNTTTGPFDQSNIYNYQESSRPGGIDKYLPGKVYSDQPASSASTNAPISSQYTGSPIIVMQQAFEKQPGLSYRPTSNGPSSNIPIANYDFTKKNKFDSSGPQIPVSGEVNDSDDKYSSSRRKPQTFTTDAPQQDNEYNVNRITEPGATKHQNINRPIPGRRPIGDNRYTTVAQTKEKEGYQYLPPQRKFEHGSQQPQNFVSTSNRPSNDIIYSIKGEVAKPFTTPDASRDDVAPEDDLEYTQGNNQYKAPQDNLIQTGLRPTTPFSQNYEKYNKENGPVNYNGVNQQRPILNQGGQYEGEKDKFTTISSTRRPTYQQTQTTSRPQQQFGPTVSVYETTKGFPDRTVRPQIGDRFYDRDGNKITYVSSSPTPSQSTHFEVTLPTTLAPEKQNLDKYVGVNDQTSAVQRFFPTTTQAPAQRPGSFNAIPSQNINDQTPPQSPYQTTYRPMVSVTSGIDSGEALGTTVRPDKIPFKRPGDSQTQVPSTTYRPALIPGNTVTEKQIPVDNFGRPVTPSELGNHQVVPSTTYRPAFFPSNTVTEKQITVDNFGRPVPPSELENQQVIPSTTYRPAFYPSNTVTEKQTIVDNFGRPVPNSDLNQQEYRPGFSGASENIGLDSQRPQSVLKPIFDMYGRPLRPSGGSAMDKVFGEDFSGPKQAQKFDPERGYYY